MFLITVSYQHSSIGFYVFLVLFFVIYYKLSPFQIVYPLSNEYQCTTILDISRRIGAIGKPILRPVVGASPPMDSKWLSIAISQYYPVYNI